MLAQLVLLSLACSCANVERAEYDESIARTRDVTRLATAGDNFREEGKDMRYGNLSEEMQSLRSC
jgi:hypothetical protein